MNNIRIMGEGTVGSGQFGKISVMGEAELLEEFSAENLNVYGEAQIKKIFKIKKVKVMGELEALDKGEIVDELNVYGEAQFNKSVEINYLGIKGEVKIGENLKVTKTNILGELNVNGDCDAEEFNCRGEANIKGLLNCESANIELYGYSKINEIGGEKIKVKKPSNIFGRKRGSLKCFIIEADEIDIVNTECKIIRGNNIVIGKGCKIDKIECTGALIIDKNSEVKETVWKKD